MVIDARTLGGADQLEAEVCIVGAGPAGITLALELAGSGCRVCPLESGGQVSDAASAKLSSGRRAAAGIRRCRARGAGCGRHVAAMVLVRRRPGRGVRARPLDAVEFEAPRGIPYTGWPFGYRELEPFYEQAPRVCRLGPYDYTMRRWETADAGALALHGGITSAIFQHGFDDFASFLDDLARSERVRLVVKRDSARDGDRWPDGRRDEDRRAHQRSAGFAVNARLYVLAAGGIVNPRPTTSSIASRSAASNASVRPR